MLGNIGFPELMIILVVALVVFGPKRLPEMGKAIGSAVTEFKKGISGHADADKSDSKQIPAEKKSSDSDNTPAG